MINLDRNAYGPCGHHAVNIGTQGCAICERSSQEVAGLYLEGVHGGGSAVEEVKVPRPMDRSEMNTMLAKYVTDSNSAHEQAATLRQRIVKGQEVVRRPGLTPEQFGDAQSRLNGLVEELRVAEWREMIGAALVMSHAIALHIQEVSRNDGWRPPGNSVMRVYMPGICDIAVRLDNYGEAGADGAF